MSSCPTTISMTTKQDRTSSMSTIHWPGLPSRRLWLCSRWPWMSLTKQRSMQNNRYLYFPTTPMYLRSSFSCTINVSLNAIWQSESGNKYSLIKALRHDDKMVTQSTDKEYKQKNSWRIRKPSSIGIVTSSTWVTTWTTETKTGSSWSVVVIKQPKCDWL